MTVIVQNDLNSKSTADVEQGWFLVGCVEESSPLVRVRIGKAPFTIGRSASNDFRLPSQSVSKQHAQLIVTPEAVVVRDLRSTNGTYVNGRRIAAPTPVGEGDLLQFSGVEFRLGRDNLSAGDRTVVSDSPESGWLITQLCAVMQQDRFEMVFQPIVAAADHRPVAVEALVRCDIIGLESPVRLFEAAARLDLQEKLSCLCRTKAVRTFAGSSPSQELFLNTHPREEPGKVLIESLQTLREQAGSRPLVLEIHEAAVPDLAAMREFRAALRDMDIGLAYDDFGAGQSRLLELTEVPPDYLKFDRSLLDPKSIGSTARRNLLRTLLVLAADAGIATVAEGIDSQELVDQCGELGFTHFQGYFFGRPMPHAALALG